MLPIYSDPWHDHITRACLCADGAHQHTTIHGFDKHHAKQLENLDSSTDFDDDFGEEYNDGWDVFDGLGGYNDDCWGVFDGLGGCHDDLRGDLDSRSDHSSNSDYYSADSESHGVVDWDVAAHCYSDFTTHLEP